MKYYTIENGKAVLNDGYFYINPKYSIDDIQTRKLSCIWSDHLRRIDKHNEIKSNYFSGDSYDRIDGAIIESFIKELFNDNTITLVCGRECINQSNGFPVYQLFITRESIAI